MLRKDIPMPSFEEEEFKTLCEYTHLSDTAKHGLERAVVLGYPPEKKISIAPGAIVNAVPFEQIGCGVRIGLYVYISGDVTIGDHVLIGPHCSIAAGNHKFDPATGWFSARTEKDGDDSIVIGTGSWLASNVTVTGGVKIGRCCLICAGAVVTKSTEDYAIMAGIPAKKIGYINPETGEYIWETEK